VFCFPDAPAIVAGSTQPIETLDLDAIERHSATLVRRRSGGGAVYVAPGEQVWLDVYVPSSDPLHTIDVSVAPGFVGAIWKEALGGLVTRDAGLEVYSGPLVSSLWSRRWCYSGLGPGEVTLDGRKLVGLSQRRNRAGTWFFTMGCTRLDPERDAGFAAGSGEERLELATELETTLAVLPAPQDLVIAALKRSLAKA
jgi:lipoate-protein ligase A